MGRDLVGLTRPINNPLAFPFSKLSSVSNGVEKPGEKRLVPSKWNSKSSLPGDYTCCDLVVKIKECKESEHPANPKSKPAPPEPAPPEDPETHVLPEDCSESQQGPESSLTLQVRQGTFWLDSRRGEASGEPMGTQPHFCCWRSDSI